MNFIRKILIKLRIIKPNPLKTYDHRKDLINLAEIIEEIGEER